MARSSLLLSAGVVTVVLSVATAILLYVLATSIRGPGKPSPTLPLVAAVVQTLSFIVWGFLVWRQLRLDARCQLRTHNGLERSPFLLFLGVGILPVILSAVITGTALGWSHGKLGDDMKISSLSASTFLAVLFVVWGLTVAVQVTYLITAVCFQRPPARPSHQRFSMSEGLSSTDEAGRPPQQMTKVSRPQTAETEEIHQTNPFRETPSSSSPPSLIPSEGPSSLRSSFSTLPRPSSKRSLNMRPPSISLKYPRPVSEVPQFSPESIPARPFNDEGFDSWDTSQVSLQIREALQATGKHPPMKETRLTPIPGSRSPSPAKALEGPFFDQTPSDDTPPWSPLPQPSVSCPNSPPSNSPIIPNFTDLFPAVGPARTSPPTSPTTAAGLGLKLMTAFPPGTHSNRGSLTNSPILPATTTRQSSRPGSRPLSRQPSCEDHIHPLFRTTSPSPAPSPSLSTVITAAPEAGQLVDERALRSRMRKGSLPSISSPLMRSESSPDVSRKAAAAAGEEGFQPLSAIGAHGGESPPPPLPQKSSSRLLQHRRQRSASLETFMKPTTATITDDA